MDLVYYVLLCWGNFNQCFASKFTIARFEITLRTRLNFAAVKFGHSEKTTKSRNNIPLFFDATKYRLQKLNNSLEFRYQSLVGFIYMFSGTWQLCTCTNSLIVWAIISHNCSQTLFTKKYFFKNIFRLMLSFLLPK